MTHPCLHFAMNEAWILSDEKQELSDEALMKSSAHQIRAAKIFEEKYPNGNIRIQYSGGIDDDGRFLLEGSETWFYENDKKQYEANFYLGKKVGLET
jgi:antitoxin component YwqK of YwqJK toxin-antitoxin module